MTNSFSEFSFDIESSALLPEKITFCHSCDSTRRYVESCDETAHKYHHKIGGGRAPSDDDTRKRIVVLRELIFVHDLGGVQKSNETIL